MTTPTLCATCLYRPVPPGRSVCGVCYPWPTTDALPREIAAMTLTDTAAELAQTAMSKIRGEAAAGKPSVWLFECEATALADERDRLRAGLECMAVGGNFYSHYQQRTAAAVLAGADLRDRATRGAVAAGTWTPVEGDRA